MPQLAQLRFAASVATVQAPSARPSALLPSAHRFAEPRGFKTDRQQAQLANARPAPPTHITRCIFLIRLLASGSQTHTRTAPSRASALLLLPVHIALGPRLPTHVSNSHPRSRATAEVGSIRSLGSDGTLAAYERRECALAASRPRQALAFRPMHRSRAQAVTDAQQWIRGRTRRVTGTGAERITPAQQRWPTCAADRAASRAT